MYKLQFWLLKVKMEILSWGLLSRSLIAALRVVFNRRNSHCNNNKKTKLYLVYSSMKNPYKRNQHQYIFNTFLILNIVSNRQYLVSTVVSFEDMFATLHPVICTTFQHSLHLSCCAVYHQTNLQ